MRPTLIAALSGAQIIATPAAAAELAGEERVDGARSGAFAGARLRLALDRRAPVRLRGGLVAAPAVQARHSDGRVQSRFGEGMELGIDPSAAGPPQNLDAAA